MDHLRPDIYPDKKPDKMPDKPDKTTSAHVRQTGQTGHTPLGVSGCPGGRGLSGSR